MFGLGITNLIIFYYMLTSSNFTSKNFCLVYFTQGRNFLFFSQIINFYISQNFLISFLTLKYLLPKLIFSNSISFIKKYLKAAY